MWLPSSFFNRAFQFESTSKFGRKRKHNLHPENVPEDKNQKRKRHRNRKSEVNGSLSGDADLKKGHVDSESKKRTKVETIDSQRAKRRDPMNMSETQDRKKARNSEIEKSVPSGRLAVALSQQSKKQAPTMKAKKRRKGQRAREKRFDPRYIHRRRALMYQGHQNRHGPIQRQRKKRKR